VVEERLLMDLMQFRQHYINASNAAEGSTVDANSNTKGKTQAGMEVEQYKPIGIALNRYVTRKRLQELFDWGTGTDYIADLEGHRIYTHDEISLKPYCASVTLYPFLLEGTKAIGGVSAAPKNIYSFCGSFVNLVYRIASNFSGAVATVEFIHMFDYFARKTWGKDYLKYHHIEVSQCLQGVFYAMNEPAVARGDQSVFWNISCFDKYYMEELFNDFYYPDNTKVNIESTIELQAFVMNWFRLERTKELLTFPVLTCSFLVDEKTKKVKDTKFLGNATYQLSRGLSFFIYMSESVDSLASCCRLRNAMADNQFSYTLGAGGVITGSARVITLNLNRIMYLTQEKIRNNAGTFDSWQPDAVFNQFLKDVSEQVHRVHKYLYAHRTLIQDNINAGLLPVYTAGFIDLDRQYLTVGINGALEALEQIHVDPSTPDKYKEKLSRLLSTIKDLNKVDSKVLGVKFNTEFVPAENLGVKHAKWDRELGVPVKDGRVAYNSYFYAVEDTSLSILDKIDLYSKEVTENLDGGSALHLNLGSLPSQDAYKELFNATAKAGVPYWTTNIRNTVCFSCGHINPECKDTCSECGSTNVGHGTRVIGYLVLEKNMSPERQLEAAQRYYTPV
jgi:ribonucleoside-triphosphate reductase